MRFIEPMPIRRRTVQTVEQVRPALARSMSAPWSAFRDRPMMKAHAIRGDIARDAQAPRRLLGLAAD